MRLGFAMFVPILAASTAAGADVREVRGRVVDEAGRPVEGADVAPYWSANGTGKLADGRTPDLTKADEVKTFWGNIGRMDPRGAVAARTGPDGRFVLKMHPGDSFVMAQDGARRRGGLARMPKGREDEPLEIRLAPLVRIRGRIDGPKPGERPAWTHVYTLLLTDPTRPVDSTRLVGCGSFDARFEMALPPGRYTLDGYNEEIDARIVPDPEITLDGSTSDVDLGIFRLTPTGPHLGRRVELAKSAGTFGDATKLYGQAPPPWHAADARGVSKDATLADFRGKWVLLDFWGPSCRPCIKVEMPKLIRFYEDHADKRDRFEILSICIDLDGEIRTMADLDRTLRPIVQHVWGGKTLPFPILLDPTFTTWERFGLPGLGTVMLVDPAGKLVRGDLATLADRIK